MEKKIDSKNIGYKLLKSMGWIEGKSLGKTNQGLLEPIKIDIETKITKEPNKNYKGKKKKSSNNNFTLSSFKSKLYNSKEDLKQKNIIENDKLANINKENLIILFKDKNNPEEKELKRNLNILINLFYNKYYIDNEKEYLFLKHSIEQNSKKLNEEHYNNLGYEDRINLDHPIKYNLRRLEEITHKINDYYQTKEHIINEKYSYSDDIVMNGHDIEYKVNNDYNSLSDVSNIMSSLLELENFIVNKNLKALTEEMIYYKDNLSDDERDYSIEFCIRYFNCVGKLCYLLKSIISNIFFYCSECCINFNDFGELKIHMENDCVLDLSDN